MTYEKQMLMIWLEVQALNDCVQSYQMVEKIDGSVNAGVNVAKNHCINKTAIHRQIVNIRQRLILLDKSFQ